MLLHHKATFFAAGILAALGGCMPAGAARPGASGAVLPSANLEVPAGQCRLWFADRSPEEQPPPGDCGMLRKSIPPGARLIYGKRYNQDYQRELDRSRRY